MPESYACWISTTQLLLFLSSPSPPQPHPSAFHCCCKAAVWKTCWPLEFPASGLQCPGARHPLRSGQTKSRGDGCNWSMQRNNARVPTSWTSSGCCCGSFSSSTFLTSEQASFLPCCPALYTNWLSQRMMNDEHYLSLKKRSDDSS